MVRIFIATLTFWLLLPGVTFGVTGSFVTGNDGNLIKVTDETGVCDLDWYRGRFENAIYSASIRSNILDGYEVDPEFDSAVRSKGGFMTLPPKANSCGVTFVWPYLRIKDIDCPYHESHCSVLSCQ
jgi:hypothetical protein